MDSILSNNEFLQSIDKENMGYHRLLTCFQRAAPLAFTPLVFTVLAWKEDANTSVQGYDNDKNDKKLVSVEFDELTGVIWC